MSPSSPATCDAAPLLGTMRSRATTRPTSLRTPDDPRRITGRQRLILLLTVSIGVLVLSGSASAGVRELLPARPEGTAEATTVPTTATPPTTAAPSPTLAPPTTVAPPTTLPPTTHPASTVQRPPATTVTAAPAATAGPGAGAGGSGDYAFLDCVRWRESRGDYRALNPSGAAGAYQLMPETARTIAQRSGRPDLAATPVLHWSPADQDLMAAMLLSWQGRGPWGGSCQRP